MMKLIVNNGSESPPGKIGRNDPCACGSGQKYKKCCLPRDEARSVVQVLPVFDRREMEGLMKKIGKIAETKNLSVEDLNRFFVGRSFDEIDAEYDGLAENNPKSRAEAVFEKARTERSAIKRVALTQQALEIYPGLPDAWCLLADEKAKTCLEGLAYIEKAVEAGRKDLGEEFFKKNEGHFWGMIESRPFMRAKSYLADALLQHGRIDEAIIQFEDCLRLNPNDNQGLRYELLSLYLLKDLLADAEKLFKQYKDDCGASWEYSKALYLFKKHGAESLKAAKQLNAARKANKYVAEYFTGKKKLPKTTPSTYQLGSKEEALIYVNEGLRVWRSTPGAVEWLRQWA